MQRLWSFSHALEVRSKRMARTLGITGPQRLAIRIIGQRPRITACELANVLGMHPSTLTGVLARLQAQRLIARNVVAGDRRRASFELTVKGKALNHARQGTVEAAVRRALARASPAMVAQTEALLEMLVGELARDS
jgi:DNA-binding MarR family transcriptional regulator